MPIQPGSLVLWDTCCPHHNVAADAANTKPRLAAYVDMAPYQAGNYAPPEVQRARPTTARDGAMIRERMTTPSFGTAAASPHGAESGMSGAAA